MAYQFASKAYAKQFPAPETMEGRWAGVGPLREGALSYLKTFNAQAWYDEPLVSILRGEKLVGGKVQKTKDAFERENGTQVLATDEQADLILKHIHEYKPPKVDYTVEFERIDTAIMNLPLSAQIAGNQMMDYKKQDSITEVIECLGSNEVERNLTKALMADEAAGKVKIIRWPAFIGCVSNFSNFLDLSRKVMRNMECGVPVVVLSRNNTTQHMFRWTLLLLDLMKKEGVDLGLLTFFSCTRAQKTKIFKACPECPAYFTCSREVAEDVKKTLPKIMSSTGGPNTMFATALTPEVSTALRFSGMIENKGQCTAMRHFVLPDCTEKMVDDIFRPTPTLQTPADALKDGIFAGIFEGVNDRKVETELGYKQLPSNPAIHFRLAGQPPAEIEEKWREPVIDVTAPVKDEFRSEAFLLKFCHWINKEQPISLAINGDSDLALSIFERTGLVVYTVGSLEKPALTAQARPEDGECFGEFPPRSQLTVFTHLPVIIPSATPGYNAYYTPEALEISAKGGYPAGVDYLAGVVDSCSAPVLGFVKELCAYLSDACGPKRGAGGGGRTPLYGLQRPPLIPECPTVLRLEASSTLDGAAPFLVPFLVTNARSQLQVSVDASGKLAGHLAATLKGVTIIKETPAEFEARAKTFLPYNVITVGGDQALEPLLAMHWVSRLFPMGHIKSVNKNDDAFVEKFSKSGKWLAMELTQSKL